METSDQLREFFAEYEARTNRALAELSESDIDATSAAFTDPFLEVKPDQFTCGKNDEQYRAMIAPRFENYRSVGTKSMKIQSLNIIPLDGLHSAVKAHWKAEHFHNGAETTIEFDVIYLVQIINGTPKIFSYITDDEKKHYREKGLISE